MLHHDKMTDFALKLNSRKEKNIYLTQSYPEGASFIFFIFVIALQ